MNLEIRPYAPEDEAAVIDLWQRCGLTRPWNNPRADIIRKLDDSPEFFLIGNDDNRVIASVMAGYDGHRGWVHYLAVDPEYQKQGIGRSIMQAAEEKLKAIGCPKIDLMVRTSNSAVIDFYETIGYGHDDVIVMSRRLIEDEPYGGKF